MDELAPVPVVVIDLGTGVCKAGFAGQEEPQLVFPTVVSRKKDEDGEEFEDQFMVGEEALGKSYEFSLKYPLERGVLINKLQAQAVYEHVFQRLEIESKDSRVLLSQMPQTPMSSRQMKLELFFETFGASHLAMAYQGVMAMSSHEGIMSGVVLDVGEGATQVTPIYEGCILESAVRKYDYGSSDVTECLRKLLEGNGKIVATVDEANKIKEETCYVAMNYQKEVMADPASFETTFESKLGPLVLSEERIIAPEILFNPEMIDLETPGIHKAIIKCVTSCEIDVRKSLYDNVILAGGGTLFPNFELRLWKELDALATAAVNIIAEPERQFSVFAGGSKMASQEGFEKSFVSKAEYEELGWEIVHQKLCALCTPVTPLSSP